MILVTGSVTAKPDAFDALRQACIDHSRRSRAEDGCIAHDAHVDAERPLRIVFVEWWRDMAALEAHFRTPGVAELLAAVRTHAAASEPVAIHEAVPVARG